MAEASAASFPVLYELHKDLEKFFDGTSSSPMIEVAAAVRAMNPAEIEEAALQKQQFADRNMSVVECVLEVLAEALERAD